MAQVIAAGWALPAVLLARAAVGLGEGVVLPAMSNLMATRVPTSWRATALGIVYSGFHSGKSSVEPSVHDGHCRAGMIMPWHLTIGTAGSDCVAPLYLSD